MGFKMPDDAIAHLQTQACENGIQQRINRDDCPIVHEIANLPANTTPIGQDPYTLGYDFALFFDVGVQVQTALIFLAEVVRR